MTMKNKLLYTLIITLLSFSVAKADNIGKRSFKLLKTIDHWNDKTYEKYIMRLEDFHQLGQNEEKITKERMREWMLAFNQKKWERIVNSKFTDVRNAGKLQGIEWNQIKYADFTYEFRDVFGLEGYDGSMHFIYNNKTYAVKISYVITENSFRLIEMSDLKEILDEPLQ